MKSIVIIVITTTLLTSCSTFNNDNNLINTLDTPYISIESSQCMTSEIMTIYDLPELSKENCNLHTKSTEETPKTLDAKKSNGLPVTPVKLETAPSQMVDDELIKIFEEQIIPNYKVYMRMYQTGKHLDLDYSNSFDLNNGNYALVRNIENISELKSYLEQVFSTHFLEKHFYPTFFGTEYPIFIEKDSMLYYNYNTGGGGGYSIDFETAIISNKSTKSFDITTTVWVYDKSETFTFHLIEQNNNYVMGNDYWYK